MTLPDELLLLSPADRRMRLGHGDVREAFVTMGTDAGVAWLEEHIESPIGPEWGNLLFALKSEWRHLDRWLRRGKLHGLAAFDALVLFSENEDSNGREQGPLLPTGADPVLINNAITDALNHYCNLRLREAADRIRHAWPAGKPIRHVIHIPEPTRKFAAALFDGHGALMHQWTEALATGLHAPEISDDYWEPLMTFGDRAHVVAVVDWRELPKFIIERLKNLQSAADLAVAWDAYEAFDGDQTHLFRKLNSELTKFQRLLVSFDDGSDSYTLFFARSERIADLECLLASAFDEERSVRRFD